MAILDESCLNFVNISMFKNMKNKKLAKILAVLMGIAGVSMIISVVYPIASYEVVSRKKYPTLMSPIVEKKNSKINDYDYTKASNWFADGLGEESFKNSRVSYYSLSIPELKIEDATVAIGGGDLTKHLIQYPGTALPGKNGNAVIFGHSILPSFYNPKNYISIFSLLPTLERGDEIKVYYDGIEYLYRVEDMFEVLPTDVQVLQQDMSDSFLTLVTCTPPGDPRKLKRLIVRARIVPPEQAYANTRS